MNSSSSTFDDSLFGCSSADKKASSKSINAVSSKYQASKSQFLNYKHNCKAMREAQKSLSGMLYCRLLLSNFKNREFNMGSRNW